MPWALLMWTALAGAAPSPVELQPLRTETVTAGGLRLVSLQPEQGRWFVLEANRRSWHLENPVPSEFAVDMASTTDAGLVIQGPAGRTTCAPWSGAPSDLDQAGRSTHAYFPICGGRLLVRRDMKGQKTTLEWSVDLVRDRWSGGDKLAEVVKETVYKDRFLETARVSAGSGPTDVGAGRHAPPAVRLREGKAGSTVATPSMGLPVVGGTGRLIAGSYASLDVPGTWVTAVTPALVDVPATGGPTSALDGKEDNALTVLVAFDLSAFEVDYEVGTEHPRVGWSERFPAARRPPGEKGPDGFDTLAPLARTGQLPPTDLGLVAATFTAGFKRQHGAFKSGPLSGRNLGSHYGFVQDGVVLSTPQPDLATLVVDRQGRVDIRTWTEADAGTASAYRHVRQNGVPIVAWDASTNQARAGALVDHWGAGNWSGSAEGQLRSLRAGACIVEHGKQRFLVYGWFSAATPAGMARVFLAAGCKDAMLLDMNALEHTYLALYTRSAEGAVTSHHLDRGMNVLDKTASGGTPMPRFVAFPDNRDFFVVKHRLPATSGASPAVPATGGIPTSRPSR